MIDALVWISVAISAIAVVIWLVDPRVRAHAEKPKVDMQQRIFHFESQYPRRDIPSSRLVPLSTDPPAPTG
jgi:hypothetical protein